MQDQQQRTIRPIATNRKALHNYEILHRFEAGIVLTGTEVKAIRAGLLNITDAYATFPSKTTDELILINLHIGHYEFGNRENHDPLRPRKLILHKQELHRLRKQIEQKGLTLVPTKMYFSGPYIKIELGLARGKKLYDKRQSLKEKDADRDSM